MEEGWEGCLSVPGHARLGAALDAAALLGASTSTGNRFEPRRSRTSTPASCSTSATTSTASSIRCASATCSKFGFNEALFPGEDLPAED